MIFVFYLQNVVLEEDWFKLEVGVQLSGVWIHDPCGPFQLGILKDSDSSPVQNGNWETNFPVREN